MPELMLTLAGYSSPDGRHNYLKCKRCAQEFYVVSSALYPRSIAFCPYCGQKAKSEQKNKSNNKEEDI